MRQSSSAGPGPLQPCPRARSAPRGALRECHRWAPAPTNLSAPSASARSAGRSWPQHSLIRTSLLAHPVHRGSAAQCLLEMLLWALRFVGGGEMDRVALRLFSVASWALGPEDPMVRIRPCLKGLSRERARMAMRCIQNPRCIKGMEGEAGGHDVTIKGRDQLSCTHFKICGNAPERVVGFQWGNIVLVASLPTGWYLHTSNMEIHEYLPTYLLLAYLPPIRQARHKNKVFPYLLQLALRQLSGFLMCLNGIPLPPLCRWWPYRGALRHLMD